MQLVGMVEVTVTTMLVTTMANKEEEGLEVLEDHVDLQVDVVVEAGEVVVGIMLEEVEVVHLMITMITDQNTEIDADSGCTM